MFVFHMYTFAHVYFAITKNYVYLRLFTWAIYKVVQYHRFCFYFDNIFRNISLKPDFSELDFTKNIESLEVQTILNAVEYYLMFLFT